MIHKDTITSFGLVALALLLGPLVEVSAQPGLPFNPFQNGQGEEEDADGMVSQVFLPAPREARQALSRAAKAIEDKRFLDAVELLNQTLGTSDTEDYFVGEIGQAGRQASLKAEAMRMIGSAPEVREAFERVYQPAAKRALEEAISQRDVAAINEVSRRYFHTTAGYEATMLLGRLHLSENRPWAAALSLQRLADSPSAAKFEPELSLLLASSWRMAGTDDAAATAAARLANYRDERVRVGETTETLAPPDPTGHSAEAQLLGYVDKLTGQAKRYAGTDRVSQWTMFRGGPDRNANTAGDLPLPTVSWRVETVNAPNSEAIVQSITRHFLSQRVPAIPALDLIAVDDTLVMRGPEGVLGIRLSTGVREWEPAWESLEPVVGDETVMDNSAAAVRMQLQNRIWQQAALSQMSSDGQRLYVISPPPNTVSDPTMAVFGGAAVIQRLNARQFGGPANVVGNSMICLELPTQGKVLWMVGGEAGAHQQKLEGGVFLGPPLPLSDGLYCVMEIRGEIRLVVLSPDTGDILWTQQLAHVEPPMTIETDELRRHVGASPSYANGVLVCPTSAGAVVAVDLATRSLLWGFQYAHNAEREQQLHLGVRRSIRAVANDEYGSRWLDGSITIAEGHVLLTPVEGDELICLDLLTGEQQWAPIPRDESLYIGGVHQGVVVVVGADSVRGIRLQDGNLAWEKPLQLDQQHQPSGRGFLSEHFYYLPTTNNEVLQVDVTAGQITDRVDMGVTLGNLYAHGDYILSLAPDMLTCFYKRGALQKQVQQRLRANPQDPWALRQQGAIHLSEGKTFEGVKALRQAIDRYTVLAGNDSLSKAELRAARSMLAASLLQLLRTQFADHQQLAQEITPLLETEQQRAEFHRVMAEGFGQHGDAMSALQHVLNLAKIDAAKQEPLPWEEGSRLERVDGQRQVACNRWISAIIQQLVSSSSPESSAQLIAKVVNETPASAERDGPAVYLTQLRQLVSNLGIHPRAVDARRTLIRELIGAGDLAEAIAHLSFLQSHATASQAARWTAEVAELLENHQEYAEAARLYRQIRLQWPLETLEDEQSVDEYVARKEQLSTFSTYLRAPRPWPNGATEVTATDARLNAAQLQSAVPFRVQQSTGPWDDSQTLAADSSRQPRIMVLDGAGQPIIEVMNDRNGSNKYVTQNVELSYAKIYGNVAVISLGQEIVAVDLSQNSQPRSDRILWQHAVGAPMIASRIRFRGLASQQVDTLLGIPKRSHVDSDGQLVGRLGSVSVNGVCFQELGELHCVDLLTGRHHWTRSDVDKGCELFGDDDLLFAVSPEDRELARVFSTQDGRELGHRKVVPWEATCTTLGRWQLYVSPATDQQTPSVNLALYDAWTEKDLWSQPFPVMSKSCLIGTDEIAVVQPNGAFQVMNIASGRVVVQQQLDAQSLSAVHVHRFPDRYIVATNRADYGGRQTLRYNVLGTNISAAEVSGKIYAIARDSGSQLWKKPVVVEDFAMPTYQPTGLPAFTLLKLLQSSSRGQRTMASALCLDIRDGSPIFFERNLSYTSANFQISGVPSLNMINLTLPDNKVYTIQFTTNPRSEQGPVEIPADDQDPDDKTEEDANPVPGLNLKGLPARLRNLRPGPER